MIVSGITIRHLVRFSELKIQVSQSLHRLDFRAARDVIATSPHPLTEFTVGPGEDPAPFCSFSHPTDFPGIQPTFDLFGEPRSFAKVRSSQCFVIFVSFSDITLSIVLDHVLLIQWALSSNLSGFFFVFLQFIGCCFVMFLCSGLGIGSQG